MKRITQQLVPPPAAGGVARYLTVPGCPCTAPSSSAASVVTPISPCGCSTWGVTDNNFGELPTAFAGDVDVLPAGVLYDGRFSTLSSLSSNSAFFDLWDRLPEAVRADILPPACYCPGQGLTTPGLAIGSPRFPTVSPLPFFWLPAAANFTVALPTVRPINTNGKPESCDCCPGASNTESITGTIVNNEIQLQYHAKSPTKELYRSKDTDFSFQLQAGYPRLVCMGNDCGAESAKRWLHFPRWPRAGLGGARTWDPYAVSSPEEPLGAIPFVSDVQCDNDGNLYIYRGVAVVHDGLIVDVLWDTRAPRTTEGPSDPPPDPKNYDFNRTGDGSTLLSGLVGVSPIGALCAATDADAAALVGTACAPACPACVEGYTTSSSAIGSAATEDAAWAAAFAALAAPPGIEAMLSPCYAKQVATSSWNAYALGCYRSAG